MKSIRYYHSCTALGAVIQRLRDEQLHAAYPQPLSARPTLLRWERPRSSERHYADERLQEEDSLR